MIHPLPHTTLNIHFFNFVGQMSLPALLTLEYADLSELSLPPLLLNFLVRSQISLQKFVLTFHNMHHTHSGNILHILEMLPSLTESGVHYTCTLGVTNDILHRLTTFPRQLAKQDVLLPFLWIFKLCNCSYNWPWSFDFSHLASLALSCCWSD